MGSEKQAQIEYSHIFIFKKVSYLRSVMDSSISKLIY